MRKLLLAAAALAALPMMSTSVSAQPGYGNGHYSHSNRVERERRECARELRRADSRREYRRERAECRREIRQAQRDVRHDRHDGRRGYDRRGYRGW